MHKIGLLMNNVHTLYFKRWHNPLPKVMYTYVNVFVLFFPQDLYHGQKCVDVVISSTYLMGVLILVKLVELFEYCTQNAIRSGLMMTSSTLWMS